MSHVGIQRARRSTLKSATKITFHTILETRMEKNQRKIRCYGAALNCRRQKLIRRMVCSQMFLFLGVHKDTHTRHMHQLHIYNNIYDGTEG